MHLTLYKFVWYCVLLNAVARGKSHQLDYSSPCHRQDRHATYPLMPVDSHLQWISIYSLFHAESLLNLIMETSFILQQLLIS